MTMIRRAILLSAALAASTAFVFFFRLDRQKTGTHSLIGPLAAAVKLITVEPEVRLEVFDFGGTGRPVVVLAGLGDTPRTILDLPESLTSQYHVYGITRRGFGGSSVPRTGYSARRLGDDVVSVIDQLALQRPVLIGHSLAGEELSSVGTYHSDKVAGLVYLEAGYAPFALADPNQRDLPARLAGIAKIVSWLLPNGKLQAEAAIIGGGEPFSKINLPVLAVFADPHDLSAKFKNQPIALAKAESRDRERTAQQVEIFARLVPSAQILRIPRASHAIFRSNRAEVLAAIHRFVATLP